MKNYFNELDREYIASDIGLWCHDCDYFVITQSDEKTGKFFTVFGETLEYNPSKKILELVKSGYSHCIIGICAECLNKKED